MIRNSLPSVPKYACCSERIVGSQMVFGSGVWSDTVNSARLAGSAHDSQAAADYCDQLAAGARGNGVIHFNGKLQLANLGGPLRQPGQQRLRPRQRSVANEVHFQLPQQLRGAAQRVEALADEGHRTKAANKRSARGQASVAATKRRGRASGSRGRPGGGGNGRHRVGARRGGGTPYNAERAPFCLGDVVEDFHQQTVWQVPDLRGTLERCSAFAAWLHGAAALVDNSTPKVFVRAMHFQGLYGGVPLVAMWRRLRLPQDSLDY